MKFNKKSQTSMADIFMYFFYVVVLSGILFFVMIGFFYLFYDYAIGFFGDYGINMMNSIGATDASAGIAATQTAYLNNGRYFDILFMIFIVAAFIESCFNAIRARKRGIISFFGFMTIGNLLLIFLLTFAVQIRGWFLNEFVFKILLVIPETPFMTMFYNYTYFIAITWYVILIVLTQVDISVITDKIQSLRSGGSNQNQDNFSDGDIPGGGFQ